MSLRGKVARALFSIVSLLALFTLILSQGHHPGDVPSAVIGLGVIVATLGVILRIMQATSRQRIRVFGSRPGHDSLQRYANSRGAVIVMVTGGIAVALIGILVAILFPTL